MRCAEFNHRVTPMAVGRNLSLTRRRDRPKGLGHDRERRSPPGSRREVERAAWL